MSNFIHFNLSQFDDDLLFETVRYLMMKKGGEREWFEVKRGLADIPKFSKLIAGLSNSGGGLIYYGWDENSNIPANIKRDDIERVLLPEIKKCIPEITIEFHPIKSKGIFGLFVGIPALTTPVKLKKTNEYVLRKGGHNVVLNDKSRLLESQKHFLDNSSGHIYLTNYFEIIKEFEPRFYADKLAPLTSRLSNLQSELLLDIIKNWKIQFGSWLGEAPSDFPIYIKFNSWFPPDKETKSYELKQRIIGLCQSITDILVRIDDFENFIVNTNQLKTVIIDNSFNEAENPVNHRKCLKTLILRQNIWNFADARIMLDKVDNNFLIYHDSSYRDFKRTISTINNLSKQSIETIVENHVKRGYSNHIKTLFSRISVGLASIITSLHQVNN